MYFLLFTFLTAGSISYQALSHQMVEEQIVRRGIKDTLVLNAMLKVERHKFVPLQYRTLAYTDRPLPIGLNQDRKSVV